jgi:Thioredoxin like C-terminal domain
MTVEYPVALDSDSAVWRAFSNRYWPAVYIADAEGQIRHHQFGEGGYEECERVIQRLLREAGREGISDDLVSVADASFEAQGELGVARDLPRLRASSAVCVSRWRRARRASHVCRAASVAAQRLGAIGGLDGSEAGERAERSRRANRVSLPRPRRPSRHGTAFARHIRAVPRPRRWRTSGAAQGLDVNEQGHGTVAEQRLYQLIREPGSITDRTFEITYLAPGVEAYAFTFG